MSSKPKHGANPAAGIIAAFDQYVTSAPTAQNAIDVVPGWNGLFPPEIGVVAGSIPLYNDNRINWMIGELGGIEGQTVLELGPLEGGHTYLLERAGAGSIEAIEANKLAFLKCLIAKELLGMMRARFHLGNFVEFLERNERRFDLVVASGVLYHMPDPLRFLELIARATDTLYLWTHYVRDDEMPPTDPRRLVFHPGHETHEVHGVPVRLYPRSYHRAEGRAEFCGGLSDDHRWIHRDDLMALLAALGFSSFSIAHEDPAHPNGPSFSVLARRMA